MAEVTSYNGGVPQEPFPSGPGKRSARKGTEEVVVGTMGEDHCQGNSGPRPGVAVKLGPGRLGGGGAVIGAYLLADVASEQPILKGGS